MLPDAARVLVQWTRACEPEKPWAFGAHGRHWDPLGSTLSPSGIEGNTLLFPLLPRWALRTVPGAGFVAELGQHTPALVAGLPRARRLAVRTGHVSAT